MSGVDGDGVPVVPEDDGENDEARGAAGRSMESFPSSTASWKGVERSPE
jgi:hypothetical protein